jgi:alcohol dehydrogenase
VEYLQEVAESRMPKSVLYGRNSIEKLGEQSKKFGKRAFIVTNFSKSESISLKEKTRLLN